jgi:glycosyltransferase involved in cell wall biosynthesis
MKKLKILVIADPHIPIPPTLYGGAERIAHLLAQEFVRQGHHVNLIAGPDSQVYNGQLFIHHAPTLNYFSRAHRKIWFQLLSAYAARNADIVVNFGRVDYLELLLRTRTPVLHCFQNPIAQYEIDYLEKYSRAQLHFYGISEHQISIAGLPNKILATSVIHNAVDTDYFQFSPTHQSYLVFLGRLTQNKGVDTAINVARRSGLPLIIAGNVSKELGGENFFESVVKPAIDNKQIRYIGPVNDVQKQELLGNALALLFPIRWDEPFGIVMVEALACGTPVIATRRASTPEVIQNKVTGFLCDNEDQMVEAVHQVHTIDRAECRRDAEQRFSHTVLGQKCLALMDKVLCQP